MSVYFRHGTADDPTLWINLVNPTTGQGVAGASPEVAIRRHRASQGGVALDNFYWNGATFVPGPVWLPMTEYDAVNQPGFYTYFFEQSLIGANVVYLVYYRNTTVPYGFDSEEHIVTDEVVVPTASGAVPVFPGDTVMGRLKDMEEPTGPVAQANADAIWDEQLSPHTLPGTTGEALYLCMIGRRGAHQITITVEDTGSNPIQGAQIDLYDAGNTDFYNRFFTDINGQVTLAIDEGTYNLRIWATGFTFTVPILMVVTGDASFTYQGTSGIVITPPTAPDLCVIYGYVNDSAGQPIAAACVSADPELPQVASGAQTGDRTIHVQTREDGYFEIELVRGSTVRFQIEGTEYDEVKVVPDAASQDITTWT